METLNHNNIKRHFNFNKLSNSNLIEDNCPYTNEYKDWDDALKYDYNGIQKIDDPNGKPEINEEEIITNDEEEDIITNDEENLNRDI